MSTTQVLSPFLDRLQGKAMRAGVLGLLICLIGAVVFSPTLFLQGYLFGYMFWINIALGSLGFFLLNNLVEGRWGFAIQRQLEAGSRTLYVMAPLFLVIIFGMGSIYEWVHPHANDVILQKKAIYLNPQGFILRAVIYFAIWLGLTRLLNGWSKELDSPGRESVALRFEKLSGIGLVMLILSVTFAATDWAMSLEPHWFSTIYGLLFVVSEGLSALAFSILILYHLIEVKPISETVTSKQFHDLGNLMLALVVLWTYVNLSQFLIIYSANLPEELPWYLRRMADGWEYVSILLIVAHFALPFLLLLSRARKQNIHRLVRVAKFVLVMRVVDHFWLFQPAFGTGISGVLANFVGFIGVGGIWLSLFVAQLRSRPLMAIHDPRLKGAFHHHG